MGRTKVGAILLMLAFTACAKTEDADQAAAGDTAAAFADLNEALRLDPGHAVAYNLRAALHYEHGDAAAAHDPGGTAVLRRPALCRDRHQGRSLLCLRTDPAQ